MEIKGLIDKIQNYCIHDGNGIRMVVFMKGCDMRCPWCSNPESLSGQIQLARNPAKCSDCGYCTEVCPEKAISKQREVDCKKCTMCGKCVEICPASAWDFYGHIMSVKEVLTEIEKDRPYYRKSGGGVTFSGGECTAQPEFLEHMLKSCQEASINTAIETNGNAPEEIYIRIAPYVDTFLIDIKHMDNNRHMEAAGVGNERILSNIRKIAFDLNKRLMLRFPLIPGYNDSEDNLGQTAAFAAELQRSGNLAMVNVLPYHSLGMNKYAMMQMDYTMKTTKAPRPDEIDRAISFFQAAGVPVKQGG